MRVKRWLTGIWLTGALGAFAYVAIDGGYGSIGARIRIRFLIYVAVVAGLAIAGIVSRVRDRRRGSDVPSTSTAPANRPGYAWPPEQYAFQQAARVSPWVQPSAAQPQHTPMPPSVYEDRS